MTGRNRVIDGRYEIKAIIGQGGMADVYLADDIILKREVAVKVLRENLAQDPVYVQRFKREASAAATLSNKNIVGIYDVGEENERYYIVMEYVSGQTLKELTFKRGALHMAEAIDIMNQVVTGVVEAHKCGIIHRDLKPQNILVTNGGLAKIADFGIASIQSVTNVTKADTIMGSLHYLAPEIARGEKASVQSDIYSLGIMFYELLTGQVPFNGESPVNIALKHMREDIPSVRENNPTIFQSVENIIIKATAKNVENRYESAKDMLEDLTTALSRQDEEKIVFESIDEDTTIVMGSEEFFKSSDTEEIEEIDEPLEKKAENKGSIKKKKLKMYGYIGMSVAVVVILALWFVMANPFEKKEVTVEIPKVAGLTVEQAKKNLELLNLTVSDIISYVPSDEYDKDKVVSVTPNEGKEVKEKSEVRLTVSTGKYILIENYVGMKKEDAKVKLDNAGLVVSFIEVNSDEPAGTVIYQSISEGQKIAPTAANKTITLQVSIGLEIKLSNYIGLDIETAKADLETLGFKVTLEKLTPPTSIYEIETMKLNRVEEQSIEPTTIFHKKGESITLYYYDKKPEIPKEEPEEPEKPTTPDTPSTGENGGTTGGGNQTTKPPATNE